MKTQGVHKLKFVKGISRPGISQWLWEGGPFTVVRYVYERDSSFPSHRHPEAQLTVVMEGSLSFQAEGKRFELRPGECLFIPGDVPHSAECGAERAVTINIFTPPRKKNP